MKTVASPVTQALILICEKCGKKLGGEADNPSRAIQAELKETIRAEGLKGAVRAVVTTCMDICPEKEIAVGISRAGARADEFFTLERSEFEGAAAALLKKARV